MNFQFKKILEKPIVLLITVNILIGLFVYRDFGLTWDEPYFYSYGDALGYAYSPKEWFSGNFDLYYSYGASGDDHKNRGPAYLFLARNIVYGVEALGADSASAWHLVNFLFFQLGIYFLYRISKRWMNEPGALFAATFFTFQPLLWGHSFINPKDPPFLTFFLAALCIGFEMVDAIENDEKKKTKKILLASFFLGIATSIRVLGPLAGLLVFIYFLTKGKMMKDVSAWRSFIFYGFLSVIIMFATWPYLWENPIGNFINVFQFMSDNPTNLSVLYNGVVYNASELPRSYLPFMLVTTLTEPTWILFAIGVMSGYWRPINSRRKKPKTYRDKIVSLSLMFALFLILITYVLVRKPSMYDGFRHFLFIIPPVFIFVGIGFQFVMEKIALWLSHPSWLHAGAALLLIVPGIAGIAKLHPYEYAYYNSFVGGMNGVARRYETEYWLTCFKETMEVLNDTFKEDINLYVSREPYIASYYANDNIHVHNLRTEIHNMKLDDYVLVNSRTNEDITVFEGAPIVLEIKKGDTVLCVVKQNR